MARSILDHPVISARYFFPRRERFPSPLLVEVDGATLARALREAAPGAPTVVHFATPEAFDAAVRERLDQRAKIAAYRGPVLLMHTRHDGLVDVSHAEQLAAASGGPVTLRIFERGDHDSILAANEEQYLDAVRAFLAPLSGS